MSAPVLERLAAVVREDGGLLAGALLPEPAGPADGALGSVAAAGPRARGRGEDLALVVEAVHEGYLLHYGTSRLFDTRDADLALLAGDRLYAFGLARLAALGDLEAVAELADVISLCAQAHAQDDPALAAAVWEAGAAAVGWGAGAELAGAKAAARRGQADAQERLRAAARQLRGDLAPRRPGPSRGPREAS
jgi:hypothetical protein